MNNLLYLRRRKKIAPPKPEATDSLPLNYVATAVKNLEALGYAFSPSLIQACQLLTLEQLTALYLELMEGLVAEKGAHRQHRPMYPNFPAQVMNMSEAELYFNAIVHYWTGGKYIPFTQAEKRNPLITNLELQVIDLGTLEEFEGLCGQIVGGNVAFSLQDREDATWFIETYGNEVAHLLPDAIPQKENAAFVAQLLMQHTASATTFLARYCHNATDVLRLAVAMSGGDASLAVCVKFRSFKRAERSLLLGLLEQTPRLEEDMLRWKERWVRLGEKLHPAEYAKRFPRTAEAFRIIRNNVPIPTLNSTVEKALADADVLSALRELMARPGDLARRLDHLLRLNVDSQEAVITAFKEASGKASTPLLLQVAAHFRARNDVAPYRVFFPKGNVAKARSIANNLPDLPANVCENVVAACEEALIKRFRELEPLGKVYVDKALSQFMVPFATRSASKSLRTVARGSRIPLPEGCNVLRFFAWWKNGLERTDIDLSAVMFDAQFRYKDVLSYYNLKGYGGCHSGDIVDAPNGASEFIDVTLERVREKGARYIVMTLNSYTQQPYCDLPECFAGWMARSKSQEEEEGLGVKTIRGFLARKANPTGEIYEPRTVQDRFDISADTRIAIPLLVDVAAKEVVWCDMSLKSNPSWVNNVDGNLRGVAATLMALCSLKKPTLYDLFRLHAIARGEMVSTPEQAETEFSVDKETHFRQEEIASNYLA